MASNHDTEYIDVLDEKGAPAGIKKTRAEIHRDRLRHRVVHVWLLNPDGELLIQRRSPIKSTYPDMWDISAAGHIDAGETPEEAVMREVKEELGIVLGEGDAQYLFTVDEGKTSLHGGGINREFQNVYLARVLGKEKVVLQEDEVAEIRWVPWRELREIVESRNPARAAQFVSHPEEYRKLFAILEKAETRA